MLVTGVQTCALPISIEEMEVLVYPGRKTSHMQPLTFPRAPSVEVPKEIKMAQAYNALGFLNLDMKEAGKETQKLYARFGVNFWAVDATNGVILNETQGVNGFTLASKKATQIANKYVRGGFRMR